jgi:aspartate-semialdehyde dehydrogenase
MSLDELPADATDARSNGPGDAEPSGFPATRRIPPNPRVAIVGATGAVGTELINCLEQRRFPLAALRLLASGRSAGRAMHFRGTSLAVEELTVDSLTGIDLALFSAGSGVSRAVARAAAARGTIVVDNSSAFRMEPDVPLVVPEVNADALAGHDGLIANPNCVAIIAAVALAPLHRANPIRRIIAATYQAASGAGAAAMEELRASTEAFLAGRDYANTVLAHPYAFNLFSHDTKIDALTGENEEETKVVRETRKILGEPELRMSITCMRVPVLRAHTIALTLEFDRPITPDDARDTLATAPGLRIVDDRPHNHFPMPNEATGQADILAGRIRQDTSDPSGRSLSLLLAGDQLLKGAALNAVQIAERLLS